MAALPLLAAMFWISPEAGVGPHFMGFMLGMTSLGLWTNQIHQWAHRPDPPRLVRLLRRGRLILSHEIHKRHHRAPYATDYCIACGWCNGVLNRCDFFRRLEAAITWMTGCRPRADEASFSASVFLSELQPANDERPHV
jgi:ubiquitin-conjugating enzyme E2 variant